MRQEIARAKLAFHEKLQQTIAYQMFSSIGEHFRGRLQLLEDACWNFQCAEARKELKGSVATKALSLLGRLEGELGEAIWIPDRVAAAIDTLKDSLQPLVLKKRQGRPKDSLGQTFRRNTRIFLSPLIRLRSLSQSEVDEI